MLYDKTFKGVNGNRQVYGINNNGDIYVTSYGEYGEDCLLGNYDKIKSLPKDSYNLDVISIPEVYEFHQWIIEKSIEIDKFLEFKSSINDDIESTNNLNDLKKILVDYLEEINKSLENEITNDDFFDC